MNLKAGIIRKQSSPNFPKNKHFLPPDTHTYCAYQGVRNVHFSENLTGFVFFETPVLRFALFALLAMTFRSMHCTVQNMPGYELLIRIVKYYDGIYDSVLKRENMHQRKPVLWHILPSVISILLKSF